MKNSLLLLALFLCFNCINKTPDVDEEEYKKTQLEYEALKQELSISKDAFFTENKDSLIKKVNLFKRLKDTVTVFENVNKDSLFFLKEVQLTSLNYSLGRQTKVGEKVVFLPKRAEKFADVLSFYETYKQLYSCEDNNIEACKGMKTAVLKEFLDIKYAFVFEGYIIIEPSLDAKDSFASGLFFGSVLVYDLVKNKPLYQYSFTATNSEEISYREGGILSEKPIEVIKRDFNSNISKAFREKTKKHFNFN